MYEFPDMNPRVPTTENLKFFYSQILQPKYLEEKESIDIGQGKSFEIPKVDYETKILRPDSTFERGGREYRPRNMFLQQNAGEAFKAPEEKYIEANVEARQKAVKAIPNLQFSLQEVELIKPQYTSPY